MVHLLVFRPVSPLERCLWGNEEGCKSIGTLGLREKQTFIGSSDLFICRLMLNFVFIVSIEFHCTCTTIHFAVIVPDRAIILDWVLADGPPNKVNIYDNNKRRDFHAIVPKAISEELYWAEEEQWIYRKLQEERRSREEAARAKVNSPKYLHLTPYLISCLFTAIILHIS